MELAIVAAAIFAHAWVGHLKAPPPVLPIVAWVVVVFMAFVLVRGLLPL